MESLTAQTEKPISTDKNFRRQHDIAALERTSNKPFGLVSRMQMNTKRLKVQRPQGSIGDDRQDSVPISLMDCQNVQNRVKNGDGSTLKVS